MDRMDRTDHNEIQIIRGIAIILVVLHHIIRAIQTPISDAVAVSLSYIHVEMFFVLSGFLFQKNIERYRTKGFKNFCKKKTKELVIPYFCWTYLFLLALWLIGILSPVALKTLESKGINIGFNSVSILLNPIVFRDPQFDSLWFIYVLFIFFMVNWFIKSSWVHLGRLTVVFIMAMVTDSLTYNTAPMILQKIVTQFQWFFLGRIIEKYKDGKKIPINIWTCFTAVVFFSIWEYLIVFNDLIVLIPVKVLRVLLYNIVRSAFTISGCFIIYVVAVYLGEKRKGKGLFSFIGNKSYEVYLIHNPWFVSTICLLVNHFSVTWLLKLSVALVCVISLSLCSVQVIKKILPTGYGILFGKNIRNEVRTNEKM